MRLIPESYEIFLDDLHKDLSRLKKICVVLFPFGVLIGAINIILYSMRIGHVPQGLSIADGVMFITVAAIFGVMFCPILLILLFIVAGILRITFLIKEKGYKRIIGVIFIGINLFLLAHLTYQFRCYFHYIGFVLLLFTICLFNVYCSYKISHIKTNGEEIFNIQNKEYTNFYKGKTLSFLVICFLAFILCLVSLKFDIYSMRLANIRAENVTIYVKKPYSYFLRTKELTKIKVNSNKSAKDEGMSLYGFEKFDKATVLLRGFGGITMVYVGGNKLEIPNDYIIIPIKDKTQNLHR